MSHLILATAFVKGPHCSVKITVSSQAGRREHAALFTWVTHEWGAPSTDGAGRTVTHINPW